MVSTSTKVSVGCVALGLVLFAVVGEFVEGTTVPMAVLLLVAVVVPIAFDGRRRLRE